MRLIEEQLYNSWEPIGIAVWDTNAIQAPASNSPQAADISKKPVRWRARKRKKTMNRIRWKITLGTLLAVLTAAPLMAAEPKDKASSSISTVLVELKRNKDTFENFWETQITPRMKHIRESMAKNVGDATSTLKRLEADPGSAELVAEYEDTLSKALAEATTFLREFQNTKAETLKSLDLVGETVKKAKETYLHSAETSRKKAADFESNAEEIQTNLQKMANKLRPLVKSGKPLPPAVNADVLCLAGDRRTALLNAKISRKASENARHWAGQLDKQMLSLEQMRGDLRVAFAQADGQRTLVANLANLRRDGLLSQELAENLKSVHAISRVRTEDIQGVTNSLEQVVTKSFKTLGDLTGDTDSVEADSSGTSILLKVLSDMDKKSKDSKTLKGATHETEKKPQ